MRALCLPRQAPDPACSFQTAPASAPEADAPAAQKHAVCSSSAPRLASQVRAAAAATGRRPAPPSAAVVRLFHKASFRAFHTPHSTATGADSGPPPPFTRAGSPTFGASDEAAGGTALSAQLSAQRSPAGTLPAPLPSPTSLPLHMNPSLSEFQSPQLVSCLAPSVPLSLSRFADPQNRKKQGPPRWRKADPLPGRPAAGGAQCPTFPKAFPATTSSTAR